MWLCKAVQSITIRPRKNSCFRKCGWREKSSPGRPQIYFFNRFSGNFSLLFFSFFCIFLCYCFILLFFACLFCLYYCFVLLLFACLVFFCIIPLFCYFLLVCFFFCIIALFCYFFACLFFEIKNINSDTHLTIEAGEW